MHKDIKKPFNLGQVDFINCLPINLPIELSEIKIEANIINAIPSELNKMILQGEIDVAPVSSITYIENKDKLELLGDLCIASDGPADSVLLFSKFPIDELDGGKVLLSPASATSNKLIQIIFKEFLKLEASFDLSFSNYSAKLLIGDYALLEFSKKPKDVFIYDLGLLWKKYTELPMVFGIWVVRKERKNQRDREIEILRYKLQQVKELGLGKLFGSVVKKAQEKISLSTDFYKDYFQHLNYDFNERCKDGLKTFEGLTEITGSKLIHHLH